MANEEHKYLAQYLKDVHANLRKLTSQLGDETAWTVHCNNEEVLKTYAKCMQKLADTYWHNNCTNDNNAATSRIKWTIDLCHKYFNDKTYLVQREKEIKIVEKINFESRHEVEHFVQPYKLIDVGSCFNPFKDYSFLTVLAIDLCPANETVLRCDFLKVPVGIETIINGHNIEQLSYNSFEIVTFCFVLEYIPSSDLRIRACKKAYEILKPGGLLIINTPDSKHVGANCKIMKCWQYALACMGFTRIKYEKLKHMHCMGFRKTLHKEVAIRWAALHKEPYMEYAIHIPQDFNNEVETDLPTSDIVISVDEFKELPFSE
ncbi:hypothetical protein K1T71_012218 [Dendrolimus kikuchii]|uniref:Uncharacterized protein n=1 Tax=Dendrolimus kikuchii TaxID=765133 RepID=A0ACC1CKZ7_9NEOP|nr:hypothetical protein K1T71_012218 [Dendrolimus kikuchii]